MGFKLLLILLFSAQIICAQATLNLYPSPPSGETAQMHNNDYSVRVRTVGGEWQDLYEYKTYVNKGSGPGTRDEFEESSFVAFDFSGTVQIEVTSNWSSINSVTIRPKSKNIPFSKNGNKVYFDMDEPIKVSFEINGNRHRNLHVFANEMDSGPPENVTTIFEAGQVYTFADNKYRPSNNEVIYIEGGAIIRGEILISEKNNIKISGRGIIDQTSFRKRYSENTEFIPEYEGLFGIAIRRSSNIEIKGIIINDPQAFAIETVNSNYLEFDNLKIFSRVLWGDGIDMVATNNVSINDTFIRTSDDCIAVYATRTRSWGYIEGNSTNINVSNSSLYADAAHPIEIGWHGNQRANNGNSIYNINFNNIDILEHDEHDGAYQGAISINCSDENRCIDFQFNDVRVEDFTRGRLLNIEVEPANSGSAKSDGDKIRNISFNNLTYTGSGESPSVIQGLNCERHVDGIHFQDFKVNGQIIGDTTDYSIKTNNYVYNLTFQEANNFSNSVASGIYRIINVKTGKYLHKSAEPAGDGNSNYTISYPSRADDEQKWTITNLGSGYYNITNLQDNSSLNNSDEIYSISCKGRYTYSSTINGSFRQKWKIVENGQNYNIINAYSRAYLHNSVEPYYNDSNGDYVVTSGENNLDSQDWKLMSVPELEPTTLKVRDLSKKNDGNIFFAPNPAKNYVEVNNSNEIVNASLKLINLSGEEIVLRNNNNVNSYYIGNIRNGIYFAFLEKNGTSFFAGKLIKN